MDHKLEPNHAGPTNEVARWAHLEGKSTSSAEDLQRIRGSRESRKAEAWQTACGAGLLLLLVAVSVWAAFWQPEERDPDALGENVPLAQQDYRFRP